MSQPERVRALMRRFETPLLRYAARLIRDPELARDAVQETFIRYCEQRTDPEQNHDAGWLFAVCRSRAFDLQRQERRMKSLEKKSAEAETASPDEPHLTLERNETASQILQALESLPQIQQQVLRLKLQEGFSYRQISEVTNHSISYVGVLVHVGLKNLREKLRAKNLLSPNPRSDSNEL